MQLKRKEVFQATKYRNGNYLKNISLKNISPETETEIVAEMAPNRIIVAEDNAAMLDLICVALQKEHYDVIKCSNGAELQEAIRHCMHTGDPIGLDLIISDIRMPYISGLENLRKLRETNPSIPIILITAFGDEQTHLEARRLGASHTLDKPFEIADLLLLVNKYLSNETKRSF